MTKYIIYVGNKGYYCFNGRFSEDALLASEFNQSESNLLVESFRSVGYKVTLEAINSDLFHWVIDKT